MRRRPQDLDNKPIETKPNGVNHDIGIVLSGGGSRAAYQVGALKALRNFIINSNDPIAVVIGSSIGAINGLVLGACLRDGLDHAIETLEDLWLERTFRNTFSGSPSMAFFRSVKTAILKYSRKPGPDATNDSIFNPAPLMARVDETITAHGGLAPQDRNQLLRHVAVITTIEAAERKPLLFNSSYEPMSEESLKGASFGVHNVQHLTAKHGFASAALPTVLPPVEIDVENSKIRLVDGGISQNIPVDPAVRMGAGRVFVLDVSGRHWWLDHYGEAHDKRPDWEIQAGPETFCMMPPEIFVARTNCSIGTVLKQSVGGTTRDFMSALGATWPIFRLIQNRLGTELAYEVLSYVALHPEYARALIECGYNETMAVLRAREDKMFVRVKDSESWDKITGETVAK